MADFRNKSPNVADENQSPITAFTDKSIRRAFVRKVFMIVFVQFLITFGIVALFHFSHTVSFYVRTRGYWLYVTSFVVFFVFYIILVCSQKLTRKYPLNFICLLILTLSLSLMLGVITSYHSTFAVLLALGMTLAISLAVIVFSFQTKIDLTKKLHWVLLIGVILLLMMSLFMIIFRSQILTVVYATIGALIFCGFLAFDVQALMGGKQVELAPEDYITAALMIYVDVVNLFLMLLTLISSQR